VTRDSITSVHFFSAAGNIRLHRIDPRGIGVALIDSKQLATVDPDGVLEIWAIRAGKWGKEKIHEHFAFGAVRQLVAPRPSQIAAILAAPSRGFRVFDLVENVARDVGESLGKTHGNRLGPIQRRN
jgi:hypothetical protein